MVSGAGSFDESNTSIVAKESPDQLITFERSDGDPSARPTAAQLNRNKDNFHRKVHVNEPASAQWRAKLGTALQKDLNLESSKQWFLADWVSQSSLSPRSQK